MVEFEKLGVFYLGKKVNTQTGDAENQLLLYESKNLTTHAVCVGMTGSGKTGLGISLLEEAGIDKIPAIVIDPKGDLGNLLLTFPNLTPQEFKPWVEESVAESKGLDRDTYSQQIADQWKKGLSEWGEDAQRIKAFREAVNLKIYTPASNAGIPLSIMASFQAPPTNDADDPSVLRDRILSTTSSLLGLLGISADPIKDREHILISTLIEQAWKNGKDLDIGALIQQIQKPPFTKIGALDIETFYPQKDRKELSIKLNNLLASPGFKAWMEGVPLDIKSLLYSKEGKPNISIISIAHLSDSERMFFVTLLLNEFISWMRRQEGTTSLRAILYMDEIFGFFPPVAMPSSKLPMLTLLKTARAFGVGIVLVTQNPVDLDYKGLSNCGTWFIGKLQTEQDKSRLIEGLKTASQGSIDAKEVDRMITMTGKRIFMMHSVYLQDPVLFQTRWTLSYLAGPMTLSQIEKLTEKNDKTFLKTPEAQNHGAKTKPSIPPEIEELFYNQGSKPVHYTPMLIALGKLHFVDTKNKVDIWEDICFTLKTESDGKTINWDECVNQPELKTKLAKAPIPESTFDEPSLALLREKNYRAFEKAFALSLYQNQTFDLFLVPSLNLTSKQGESEGEFRIRAAQKQRETRDTLLKKLQEEYQKKITPVTTKLKQAQERVSERKQKVWFQKIQTFIYAGATLIGSILGKGVTKRTINETGTTLRQATRIGRDRMKATDAEEDVKAYQEAVDDLTKDLETQSRALSVDPETIAIETIHIKPRKTDITVEKMALLWAPTAVSNTALG